MDADHILKAGREAANLFLDQLSAALDGEEILEKDTAYKLRNGLGDSAVKLSKESPDDPRAAGANAVTVVLLVAAAAAVEERYELSSRTT